MREETAFFHGCIEVEETRYGLIPRRFTKAQLAYWDRIGMVRAARAHSLAGTQIRLFTEETEISFSYRVLSVCGEKMTFDLYEGERLTDSATLPSQNLEGRVEFALSGHDREVPVTVYLPFTAELAFSDFQLGEKTKPVGKDGYRGRLLWLGDSISQGMHARHPALTLTGILSRAWNYEIVNQGVGGCGYKDICQDFTYGPWHPDNLVLVLGTNDTGPAQAAWNPYREQVRACLDRARKSFAPEKIRLISPFWRGDRMKPEIGEPLGQIVRLLREEARIRRIPFIDGEQVSPHCSDLYWDERLHPNDAGFAAIGEALRELML